MLMIYNIFLFIRTFLLYRVVNDRIKEYKQTLRQQGGTPAQRNFRALFKNNYTYIHALRDISFTINDGEMVGFIGPNGARKKQYYKNHKQNSLSRQW